MRGTFVTFLLLAAALVPAFAAPAPANALADGAPGESSVSLAAHTHTC